jgi:LysM repeat protein
MKFQTLPVKRRPVSKGVLRRLSAVTRNRKQRVAAASVPAGEMEVDDGSSKISRALTIIFLIHIVAIGLIFIHQRFLDGRPAELSAENSKATVTAASTALPSIAQRSDLPQLSTGETPYVVKPGDNYARIAASAGVDEGDLRLLNKHVDIGPGLILKIPPKRIVAEDPPEVTSIREQNRVAEDHGLVEAVDVSDAPKAQPVQVRPSAGATPSAANAAEPVVAPGKSYVVQPGDSIWRIANRFKVSQEKLMKANNIGDARKMKIGMKLVIPQG